MTFAGLRNDAQRMAVLAYLTTLGAADDEGDSDDAGGEESSEDTE
jgi:hypothetical protein